MMGFALPLVFLTVVVVSLVWQKFGPDKTAAWPITEGMIQSVNTEIVYQGRGSHADDVCDFSYVVNGDYYSGRLLVSRRSEEAQSAALTVLVNKKFPVRYNPRKPEKFAVVSVDLDGFCLGQHHDSPFTVDEGPTVLNIDER